MTIEELQAKREEINRQIREMWKMGEVEVPGARIIRKTSYTGGPEEWSVRIAVDQHRWQTRATVKRYLTVYTGGSKRECVDAIPGIMGVLSDLHEEATKGERE